MHAFVAAGTPKSIYPDSTNVTLVQEVLCLPKHNKRCPLYETNMLHRYICLSIHCYFLILITIPVDRFVFDIVRTKHLLSLQEIYLTLIMHFLTLSPGSYWCLQGACRTRYRYHRVVSRNQMSSAFESGCILKAINYIQIKPHFQVTTNQQCRILDIFI